MGQLYVYRSVFIAQISFMIGCFAVTWSSPMLSKLHDFDDNPLGRNITSSEDSWLASTSTLGACSGAITIGTLTSMFGRKTLLISLACPLVISYLIMAWAKTIWLFYICRFFTGFTLGGINTVLPMYCGEIADAENRGILGSSMTVFINLGMLLPYCIGPYIPFFWFHIILAVLPVVYIVAFYLGAPESPHYLIKKDKKKALNVLEKLRGESRAADDLRKIKEMTEKETHASTMDILQNKGLRKAFIMGIGGFTFMQLTGTGIVAAYNAKIFKDAGGIVSAEEGPIIVAVAQLITTIIISSVADRFPRKLLLTISHAGVSLVLVAFGIYFFKKNRGDDVTDISWLPLTCLILYVTMYNVGIGPILAAFLGELFPSNVKGIAVSIMVVYNWGSSFLLVLLFNTFIDLIGMHFLFWIFSLCGLIAIIFIRFCMVETKGKTLQEIQDELNA